jgi:hypothetical protein
MFLGSRMWPVRGADHLSTIYEPIGTNFADKRRSLDRYSSLVDSGHGVFLLLKCYFKEYFVKNWTKSDLRLL